jgi:hypothetical protein
MMRNNSRRNVYKDESPLEYVRIKERLSVGRSIKTRGRDKNKREIF